jgi:hypothetical protein
MLRPTVTDKCVILQPGGGSRHDLTEQKALSSFGPRFHHPGFISSLCQVALPVSLTMKNPCCSMITAPWDIVTKHIGGSTRCYHGDILINIQSLNEGYSMDVDQKGSLQW